ncbi:MAG: endonuclease I family protein, partial [Candidatus Sericytochromatia bacterium]
LSATPTAMSKSGFTALARPVSARTLDNYYAQAAGKQGSELLYTLNRIVAAHKDLGYDRARDVMFGEADDVDGDNVVECDYTDRVLENVTNRGTAYRGGSGFNAEHTWPQSKGAVGAAKADLHHLFPTDCKANSVRGSFPFGEVKSADWTQDGSQRGTNGRGDIVFEPKDEQKGNTARAILYFYTVYGQSADLQNFRIEEEVLKRWHQQDPVDAIEKARNEVVFKAQGNRNPFVDHPEFVQKIGTFHGAGTRFDGLRMAI